MKYYLLLLMLLLLGVNSNAQYPFEKYPSPKYRKLTFKEVAVNDTVKFGAAHYGNYTIKLLTGSNRAAPIGQNNNILLYYKGKLVKKASGYNYHNYGDFEDVDLFVGDVNGDGLPDFKMAYYSSGPTGLASTRLLCLTFLARKDHGFDVVSFTTFAFTKRQEFDFDGDGKFEFVTQYLKYVKGHSYWVFDVFSYQNGHLVNVDDKYRYPIAVQYLNHDNFKPTNRISRQQLLQLSHKLPEDYSVSH